MDFWGLSGEIKIMCQRYGIYAFSHLLPPRLATQPLEKTTLLRPFHLTYPEAFAICQGQVGTFEKALWTCALRRNTLFPPWAGDPRLPLSKEAHLASSVPQSMIKDAVTHTSPLKLLSTLPKPIRGAECEPYQRDQAYGLGP